LRLSNAVRTHAPSPFRLALVTQGSADRINAIAEYTAQLTDALMKHEGLQADLHLRSQGGRFVLAGAESEVAEGLVRQMRGYDAMVLQYNPFMYGRWGFTPWLPLALLRLRRKVPRPLITLMVHEPCIDMLDWRSVLMGLWQRVQLASLVRSSDIVFVSVEAWATYLRARRRSTAIFHLPVGSNLPDGRESRLAERARLGVAPDGQVLAAFGTGHPARISDYIVAAANRLARSGRPVTLLNLGHGAPGLAGLDPRVRVHHPGQLPGIVVAARLASADIFLAPYVDGVSSRRTALMAALQHALPVVGTDGASTDPLLRGATDALRLLPVGNPELFAESVFNLALSADLRSAMGRAARRLYEESFDWPVLAGRLLGSLQSVAEAGLPPAGERRVRTAG
jgi:glycosyltransferase involved in cell wall biosynthesis